MGARLRLDHLSMCFHSENPLSCFCGARSLFAVLLGLDIIQISEAIQEDARRFLRCLLIWMAGSKADSVVFSGNHAYGVVHCFGACKLVAGCSKLVRSGKTLHQT